MVSMAQHDLLSILRQLMSHRGSNQLLLWLLSVCGTGFLGRAQRKWVLSQLADVLEDLEIKSWEKMLENLQQVMWHNYQDEQQQRELWEEVIWHNYQDEQQQRESWEELMSKHEFTAQERLLEDTGRPKLEDLWLAVLR
jgi:Fungal specific transcription factor domain